MNRSKTQNLRFAVGAIAAGLLSAAATSASAQTVIGLVDGKSL